MLRETGALLEGHFRLSSGLHSPYYVQCALLLEHPRNAVAIAEELAELVRPMTPSKIIGPALGGMIIGYAVAQSLDVPFIFAERKGGGMTLRRGFSLAHDQHVLVVEDVWTTGGSTQEAIRVVEEAGARVVAAGALIDRSGGKIDFEVETQSLIQLPIASYEEEDCPLCREGSVAVKPGSRFVRTAH